MAKTSIWTVLGRMERLGIKVTNERLEVLLRKRKRQLKSLIERTKDMKSRRRFESRLRSIS